RTEASGAGRPKRPTGGKAPSGRACEAGRYPRAPGRSPLGSPPPAWTISTGRGGSPRAFGFIHRERRRLACGRCEETTMWYSAVGSIVTLILSLLAVLLAAAAQPAGKVARVGLLSDESPSLSTGSSSETTAETLSKALRDLGWVEGQNLTFERRHA